MNTLVAKRVPPCAFEVKVVAVSAPFIISSKHDRCVTLFQDWRNYIITQLPRIAATNQHKIVPVQEKVVFYDHHQRKRGLLLITILVGG